MDIPGFVAVATKGGPEVTHRGFPQYSFDDTSTSALKIIGDVLSKKTVCSQSIVAEYIRKSLEMTPQERRNKLSTLRMVAIPTASSKDKFKPSDLREGTVINGAFT